MLNKNWKAVHEVRTHSITHNNQHEGHDVIDRNAYSGHVNAPVLKRFETGFETGLKLAMWKGA